MAHQSRFMDFIDWLVPLPIRQKDKLPVDTLMRARFTASLLVSFIASMVGLLGFFAFAHLVHKGDFHIALWIISAGLLLLSIQYAIFRLSGNLGFTAVVVSVTFFLCTLVAVFTTGGWNSPVKPLFFCAPVISFLLAGRQEGLYTSALMIAAGTALMVMQLHNFDFIQIMKAENINIVQGVIWLMASIVMIACLTIYDTLLEDLSIRLQRLTR